METTSHSSERVRSTTIGRIHLPRIPGLLILTVLFSCTVLCNHPYHHEARSGQHSQPVQWALETSAPENVGVLQFQLWTLGLIWQSAKHSASNCSAVGDLSDHSADNRLQCGYHIHSAQQTVLMSPTRAAEDADDFALNHRSRYGRTHHSSVLYIISQRLLIRLTCFYQTFNLFLFIQLFDRLLSISQRDLQSKSSFSKNGLVKLTNILFSVASTFDILTLSLIISSLDLNCCRSLHLHQLPTSISLHHDKKSNHRILNLVLRKHCNFICRFTTLWRPSVIFTHSQVLSILFPLHINLFLHVEFSLHDPDSAALSVHHGHERSVQLWALLRNIRRYCHWRQC